MAVTLWIAGGGLASASGPAQIYITANDTVNMDNTIAGKDCVGTTAVSDKALLIGGTWSSPNPFDSSYTGYLIFAANASYVGHNSGYTLNVDNATFNNVGLLRLYGARYGSNLENNSVVITNSKIIGDATIYGGYIDYDGTVSAAIRAAIRAASIKGSSVRGEIGMKMNATKTNPWQVDVSLYGYGGKHRGFGGNVNVAYMF